MPKTKSVCNAITKIDITPIDRYFERVLGMPLTPGGGCVSTPVRLLAHPPFLAPCMAMELNREGVHWQSFAPSIASGDACADLSTLGQRIETLCVYCIQDRLQTAPLSMAIPLDLAMPISGAIRLPKQGDAMGIVVEGRYVAWACASDICGLAYLTVETDSAHRGKGYAKDCLFTLTSQLLQHGKTPFYLCASTNIASQKTAMSAGYTLYGLWSMG